MTLSRINLSPPHLSGLEQAYVADAFDSNWIAPIGPNVDAFEQEFAAIVNTPYALALNSGTAAIHLSLILAGVGHGDEVLVSNLTFAASVNPILYQNGFPTFIDSESHSWNMDPELLCKTLDRRALRRRLPKAVILVHLYGQSANIEPILNACDRHGVLLIEDAAEALGATYHERAPGTFGKAGIYSFNGNKIITTSGGGMLVSEDASWIAQARKLATQARDSGFNHYEHTQVGYNYRLSNILAGIGRGQLSVLSDRVAARRHNFAAYQRALGHLPGLSFAPEAEWGLHTRWLTIITIDPPTFGATSEELRLALEAANIEARSVWKPMHLQPIFSTYESVGGDIAATLFQNGLCLPSGSNLTPEEHARVCAIINATAAKASG